MYNSIFQVSFKNFLREDWFIISFKHTCILLFDILRIKTRLHFYSTVQLPNYLWPRTNATPKRTLNNTRKSYSKTALCIIYTDTNSQETSPPSNEEPISIADLKKKKNGTNQLKRNGRKFLLVARRAWEKFPADTRGQLKRRISPRLAMLGWNNAVA